MFTMLAMTTDRPARPEFDPGSVKPLYEQAADWVQAEIEAGRLKPGQKFADSRDLADEWGVAYQTVRRTMQELRDRGLVDSRVGKGTFVKVQGETPA
jgi:DNA-binding GntR family transcriptional regulator